MLYINYITGKSAASGKYKIYILKTTSDISDTIFSLSPQIGTVTLLSKNYCFKGGIWVEPKALYIDKALPLLYIPQPSKLLVNNIVRLYSTNYVVGNTFYSYIWLKIISH